MFDPVDPKQRFPDLEEGILSYWREEDTFKRSLRHRKGSEVFSFYDGPPFATGLPHYGHILAGTIKDVIPRYQTMRGKYVKRRFGWDCHGLPVENEIEKEQKLLSKRDIEALGVGNFNELCREAVQRYTGEWRKTVERLGRWVDMDHDYRTMDPEYMESIWWVFKSLHEKGLIREGHKSMHVCPRCQTPLSNFEVTQGYKDIQDYSITAKFELTDEPGTFILAWTTTGWTLPGNMLLAVDPKETYVRATVGKEIYIVAKALVENVLKGTEHTIEKEIKGKSLIGKTYMPLFPYFEKELQEAGAFRVVGADFVTTTDGTGIVHIAGGYGEDDYNLVKSEKLPLIQHVGIDGVFTKDVTEFAGKHAKPKDDHQGGDKAVAEWLKKNKKLFKAETFQHSYPHCWRCDSPLINFATSSWFVAVEEIKKKMIAANEKTNWMPSHIRDGRFGKWLEGARDWAISRNRFWGTPLPIWRNSVTGEVEIIGSRDELMQKNPERFTKIIFCRHAESVGNVEQIYQGEVPGTPLTDKGQEQAKKLAEKVVRQSERIPIDAIYASPLQRTQETATALSALTDRAIITDDRIREVTFGEYEGKHINFSDLTFVRERRAHKLSSGQVESIYHFAGMETWENIQLRLSEFLHEVLEKHRGKTVVVFTHADIVQNAMHFFTNEDPHKIVHRAVYVATSHTFFWDHQRNAQMDLHKHTVDEIMWDAGNVTEKDTVQATFVRHGETDLNKEKLTAGAEVDIGLNTTGKAQIKKLAESLKGKEFDVVLSSSMKRAEESAKILSKELEVEYGGSLPNFHERSYGEWSKEPIDEVMKKHGPKKPIKGLSPSWLQVTPQDGESWQQFVDRVRRGHDQLLRDFAGKKVLLVAHGGVLRALNFVTGATYEEVAAAQPKNAEVMERTLKPSMRSIGDVLDCWFESGSMPYAQEHFPFENETDVPPGFPADFIAEGLDQTRGWFYTLMVLSTALFDCPAFKNCVVNGIVLAEDGKKMSKRLKNYPEPTEIVNKHGADSVRFALMASPAVRGEDLRFSEKLVEETVRNVLLPLWNAYRLFVTYANAAEWKPSVDFGLMNAKSTNQLDQWIVLKTQELVNRMTTELDNYDLSATCAELAGSIDDLTNWYVRLSRRRLAGKDGDAKDALDTLYRVLIANAQLLAPFCPFVTEAMYLNLVTEEHGSIHFTDWPTSKELSNDDQALLRLMENTRTVVTLGLSLRSDEKIRVRQPLASVTVALPPSDAAGVIKELIEEELNVKSITVSKDAGSLATPTVSVDARKVGPRLGSKVQELIKAGKAGDFRVVDGGVEILGEVLTPEEAKIVYQGKEDKKVAADHGIVVALDTTLSDALVLEGDARELVRVIQDLRKDAGLEFTDTIVLSLTGADDLVKEHEVMLLNETKAVFGEVKGKKSAVDIGERKVEIGFRRLN
ncbi:MAG: class I tRNA ligase family protein [Candidatus Peribacteraceae bacterium]